jgi:CBS domain-containing protein
MEQQTRAKRVRIYLSEDDRVGLRPTHLVLVDLLRREQAAGVTVMRAMEGFGGSGQLHVSHLPELARRLPLILEWIDRPERVEALLGAVRATIQHGLITVEDTEIAFYVPHPVRALPETLTVFEVMARDAVSVAWDVPVRHVVELLVGKIYRAVPVVDGGVPVGIITSSDLVRRGGLAVRVDLLKSLDRPELGEVLRHLEDDPRRAGDVMTPGPVTINGSASLSDAAEVMSRHRLKRLPVVDDVGKLVGVVSRIDLLRAAAGGFDHGEAEARVVGLAGDTTLAAVMRTDVTAVLPDTPLPEVFQAVVSTRLNRALVVDEQRKVLGIVTDAELLDRLTPSLRPGVLRALMNRLPFGRPRSDEPADQHASARTAADLMLTGVPQAHQDTLVRDAIAAMLQAQGQGSHKLLAITDGDERLVGVVDRADLLHGLVRH